MDLTTLSVLLLYGLLSLTHVDLVLDGAIEYDQQLDGSYVTQEVGSILLNGTHVCMVHQIFNEMLNDFSSLFLVGMVLCSLCSNKMFKENSLRYN